MTIPSILEMLKAGVHFGHQTSRWHPKMASFIFTKRHGVHIINLEETKKQLETVSVDVEKMAAAGKQILFVSTKPQARDIVKQAAIDCGMPYLTDRWLGGLLTNFPEMKKLITKYNTLKQQQASGELEKYTKKEQLDIAKKLEKMDTYLTGLSGLQKMPDAIFVPAVQREKTAVIEANRTGVPIIGICDTNANPDTVTHPIPGNDDAVGAISLIVNTISTAIKKGKDAAKSKKVEEVAVAEKKDA